MKGSISASSSRSCHALRPACRRPTHYLPLIRPDMQLPSIIVAALGSGQAVLPQLKEDSMRWLAARVASKCKGFGVSEEEVLRTLKNRGIECSYVKNRKRLFRVPGETVQVYGFEVIGMLQEEMGQPSHNNRPAAFASHTFQPSVSNPSGLEALAAWISTNYMGMGKSAADVLPELRRKGITASGNSFCMNGQIMDAPEVVLALRLQARTPSCPSTPEPIRPAVVSGHSAPKAAAPFGSSGLETLAAWISTNYVGMGKSTADALPELRRKGITASGNSFRMNGQIMDAPEIVKVLRLQARYPGRVPTFKPACPACTSDNMLPAPAGSPSGLEGLATWISANYVGMGKSAADALPELCRKGITASGNSFSMGGKPLTAPEIVRALRLQARAPSRSPPRSTASPAAPVAPSTSAAEPSAAPTMQAPKASAAVAARTPAAATASKQNTSDSDTAAGSEEKLFPLESLAVWIAAKYAEKCKNNTSKQSEQGDKAGPNSVPEAEEFGKDQKLSTSDILHSLLWGANTNTKPYANHSSGDETTFYEPGQKWPISLSLPLLFLVGGLCGACYAYWQRSNS